LKINSPGIFGQITKIKGGQQTGVGYEGAEEDLTEDRGRAPKSREKRQGSRGGECGEKEACFREGVLGSFHRRAGRATTGCNGGHLPSFVQAHVAPVRYGELTGDLPD